MDEQMALCVEVGLVGEEPLVFGTLEELPELVRAVVGATPGQAAVCHLTLTLSPRPARDLEIELPAIAPSSAREYRAD